MRGNVTVHEDQKAFDEWTDERPRRAEPEPIGAAGRDLRTPGEIIAMSNSHAISAHGDGHGHAGGNGHGHDDHIHPAPNNFISRYIFSHDHKVIGIQFLFSGLIFFILGGLLALAVRWQLAWPWSDMPLLSRTLWADPSLGRQDASRGVQQVLHDARVDHDLLRDHPVADRRVRQLLDPADDRRADMAFPKLNMYCYWCMPPSMILMAYSFFVEGGSAEAGWTSYPILSVARWATPGSLNGQTFWLTGLLFAGMSSLMGSINYITTIIMLRARA